MPNVINLMLSTEW